MAEDTTHPETPLAAPQPRSTDFWRIPKVIDIEGDGMDPRKTILKDAATGEEIKTPFSALQFNVTVDEPNSMVITLGEVALRARVHLVRYEIPEEDLEILARQNGFEIIPVPAYPTRAVSYGPAEHMFLHRDLPGYQFVQPGSRATLATAEAAGANLRQYLEELAYGGSDIPAPTDLQDREFLVYAHKALSE